MNKTTIIGIAGGTGSGKTTVVNKIVEALPPHYVAVVPCVWAFTSDIHQREIQEDADPIGCYYGIFSWFQRCTEVYGHHYTRLIGWWIY